MLVKLDREALDGRTRTPTSIASTKNSVTDQSPIFLDYVVSKISGDERPYLEVSVLSLSMIGLLDSGATRTLVDSVGYQMLLRLGLSLKSQAVECTVANGQKCTSLGYVTQYPFVLKRRFV